MESVSWLEWRDVVDMGLSAALVYLLLACARTARSLAMVLGLAALAGGYALARAHGYALTSELLLVLLLGGGAYAVFITHHDVRRFLDRSVGALLARSGRGPARMIDTVVEAVERMAESRTGALIVLPGSQPLGPDVDGGVTLDAEVSVPLLLSLFDPASPGHDGALILREGRAGEFAVHLPLSTNSAALGEHGTRHAAALGLSESSDAMCVVVSEERGTVSVAKDGHIEAVRTPELVSALRTQLLGIQNKASPRVRRRPRRWLTAVHLLVALLAAGGGWVARVQGEREATRTISVPVSLEGMPEGYALAGASPSTVDVTLSGPRNQLMLVSDRDVGLSIDGWSVMYGRRVFFVDPRNVRVDADLEVRNVQPRRIRVNVDVNDELAKRGAAPPADGADDVPR